MPNHQKKTELLETWTSLKEKITDKIYELEKIQSEFIQEAEKWLQKPIEYPDQAISVFYNLRTTHTELTESDYRILKDLEIQQNSYF